ncbi:MAG: ArgE/DapE family deacylase [Chloroflexota bacterium]|nr:ArgE/DapE family deacylase [Chloroflexota bacterium]
MDAIETIEARVYRRLDAMRDDIIKLTRDLVAFKSVNPRFMPDPEYSQEKEVQDYLESRLKALGLDIARWEAEARRPNLVARRRGRGGGRSLAFNGHIDVVPIGDRDGWNYDPWGGDIVDGKLYGRGTVDMKAGLAAFIAASEAIIKSGIVLNGDLELHIVVDEEAGGFAGTRDLIKRGYRADGVIVAEPTSGYIDAAEGGLSWLRVTIRGRAAHAGWRFAQIYPQAGPNAENAQGVNAIEKGVKFLAAVRELEREWARDRHHPLMPPGITTINPGVMVGGVGLGEDGLPKITSNPAMIPDVCVIDFDFKYLPTERFEEVRAEFEAFTAAFARTDPWLRDHPPTLQWHLSNIDFPPFSTPSDHPLIEAVRDTHRQLGIETVLTGKRAVTDAAFYAGAGMTPIILGPAGAGLHGDNEFVELDSLIETAKVFAGLVLRWCGLAE